MYEVKVNTVTGSEPVSTSEAKDWALIDTSAEDTLIGTMITTARQKVEAFLSRDVVAKTRTYFVSEAKDACLTIPFPPINAITSITYGQDDTAAELDSDYYVRGLDDKYIEWTSYPLSLVKVNYSTLGMTDQIIKDAIKATFEALYNARGIITLEDLQAFDLPDYAKNLLVSEKVMFI